MTDTTPLSGEHRMLCLITDLQEASTATLSEYVVSAFTPSRAADAAERVEQIAQRIRAEATR